MLAKALQVGVALMTALMMGGSALQAAVVHRTGLDMTLYEGDPAEIWLSPTTGEVGYTGGADSAVVLGFHGGYPQFYGGIREDLFANVRAAGNDAIAPVEVGDFIDLSSFQSGFYPTTPAYFFGAEWEGTRTGYIALMFEVGLEEPGDLHYGWLHVTVGSDEGRDFITLHGFGFEDTPNVGIQVIPEPSTALLAVGGAAGLLLLRRTRRRV